MSIVLFACLRSNRADREGLEQLAADFTPRYERQSETVLTLDISGLGRIIGPPRTVGEEIRRVGADRGLYVSVAMASTRTAARLMVEARAGVSLIEAQHEAEALSRLPITLLTALVEPSRAGQPFDIAQGVPSVVEGKAYRHRSKDHHEGGTGRINGATVAVRMNARGSGSSRHYRMAPAPALSEPADAVAAKAIGTVAQNRLASHRRSHLCDEDRRQEASDASVKWRRSETSFSSGSTEIQHVVAQSFSSGGPGNIEKETVQGALDTLRRWGIKTLGELAALPSAALFERLGSLGLTLQSWARGEDGRPLVSTVPIPQFVETLELEWPIDTLEPLSFVLSRLFEPLCHRLEQHDLAAAVVHVYLTLVSREQIERTLQLPAPMRDPKVLRTLVLLDLEARPPHAGIDRVTLEIEPALGRIVQHSLLVRALPAPEELSTLVARLTALMGEGRCGAPELLDTHRSSAFTISPFQPSVGTAHLRPRSDGGLDFGAQAAPSTLALVLRRLRFPVAVRVTCEKGRPVRVASGRRGLGGGRIVSASGPWRSSGEWWSLAARSGPGAPAARSVRGGVSAGAPIARCVRDGVGDAVAWDHDEWDVELGDGRLWRLAYARDLDRWLMHGQFD